MDVIVATETWLKGSRDMLLLLDSYEKLISPGLPMDGSEVLVLLKSNRLLEKKFFFFSDLDDRPVVINLILLMSR